jgi:flagellar hook-associated protein 3 FlgL
MRISSAASFDASIDTLMGRQRELAQAQQQLSSGKRVALPSDDPSAMARAERALAGLKRAETSQRAVDASRIAMTQTEQALADAGGLLQDVRDALVAAGDASYSDAERKSLAEKLRGLRTQLLAVANRSDGAGTFLFGGQGAAQAPFVDAPGGVQYAATSGQSVTEPGTGLPLTTDGQAIWLSARTGNGVFETRAGAGVAQAWIDPGQVTDPSAITGSTYTVKFSVAAGTTTYAILKDGLPTAVTAAAYVDGQNIAIDGMSFRVHGAPANGDNFQCKPATPTLTVFDALDKAVADLGQSGQTGAQRTQANSDNLRNLDAVMQPLQSARSLAGEYLNRIDSETSRIDDLKLARKAERSAAEDLDMVQAISAFQAQQTGYDAALKSYSMVQRLSLFQYLNP